MEELEQSAKQIRMNADLLEGLCQGKLAQLFQEKRKARKAYQEEHSKIAAKFNNVSVSSIIPNWSNVQTTTRDMHTLDRLRSGQGNWF